jgi:hypothetical protein
MIQIALHIVSRGGEELIGNDSEPRKGESHPRVAL